MDDKPDVRLYFAAIVILIVVLLLLIWLTNPNIGIGIQTNITKSL